MRWENNTGVDYAGGLKDQKPKKCETQLPEPVLEKDKKTAFRSSRVQKTKRAKQREIFMYYANLTKQLKSDKYVAKYPKVLLKLTIFSNLISFTM